ncbi:MAG: arsenite methyltransferase, partial [Armatimonadetes bacterium]|nr:arsenite methyltransferase [Armatimonadota bacterium]
MDDGDVKNFVRESYAGVAGETSPDNCDLAREIGRKIGYEDDELASVPDGANLGLGCGNPIALASLREGETVLDLGAGGGFDCFLAADKVGPRGRVIGIDMTPEMVEKARENASKGSYDNVEFRLGDIENLPLPDDSVDIVLSNCVINLSSDKEKVFRESFRVLRQGGRLMISDIVLLKELPAFIRTCLSAYAGCISGTVLKDRYIRAIEEAGFKDVRIVDEIPIPLECVTQDPTAKK